MTQSPKRNSERRQPELFEVIRGFEEMNLVEAPLAVLSKTRPRGVRTLRFQDTVWDKSQGQEVVRRWVISVIEELPSVPTAIHMDVLLALFRIASEQPDKANIPFTLYQVCQELNWGVDGRSYKRIKDSLRQWTGTNIRFENAFRRGKRWVSEKGFNIICWYELTRGEDFDPEEPHRIQHFVLNPKILESIRSEHIKTLDWSFYRELKSAPAKRLYRLLDKRFYGTDFYMPRLPFVDFCQEKIGMSRSYKKPAKYREKIKPAFDELLEKGFLSNVRYVEKSGVQKVEFRKGRVKRKPRAENIKPEHTLNAVAVESDLSPVATELVSRGMTKSTAIRWAAKEPEEAARQIEFFDFKRSKGWKPESNSGGYLNRAIKERFSPPDGFKSKADREELAAKKEAKRRAKAVEAKNEAAKREQEKQERKAKEERIERIRNTIPEERQLELENEALKNFEQFKVTMFRTSRREGNFTGFAFVELWDEHIIPKHFPSECKNCF